MENKLKGKKILITSGPVWVPVDNVRIVTSIFGGALGVVMAKEAERIGADVVMLMGPGRADLDDLKNVKIVKFKYFNELFDLMHKEIASKKYDVVVHSAAVPDYVPKKFHKGKIKSGKKEFKIEFKPTVKIVDYVKKWDPSLLLVKFKLEVGKSQKELLKIAKNSMIRSKADMIVANDLKDMDKAHTAMIVTGDAVVDCIGKKDVAKKLFSEINKKI